MSTLRRLFEHQVPSSVEESLSFLHVVNAMRRFIQELKPVIGSEDQFLDDLSRWRLTVPEHKQALYDEVVFVVWGKPVGRRVCEDTCPAANLDLVRFHGLASGLVGQTGVSQGPLRSQGFGGYRLRTMHSAYESLGERPVFRDGNGRGDSRSHDSSPGSELELLYPSDLEDRRGLAQEAPSGSPSVIFLMAGGIFATVVTFLTSTLV